MKNLKVWVSRLLIGIMTFMCFAGNSAPLEARAAEAVPSSVNETESEVHYVALGDSITRADNSYVNEVSSYLKKRYGKCVTSNLSVNAWKSKDLLDALTNPANSKYSSYRAKVKDADVITLDIGSNDVLITAREIGANVLGCTESELDMVAINWFIKLQNASGFSAILLYLQAYSIVSRVKYEIEAGSTLPNAVVAYEQNFVKILAEIKKLAPNAKVYIGNIYNPYVDAPSMCLGDYEFVAMEKLGRDYAIKLNRIIKNNANGNVVVDLYNTINNPKYIQGDVLNYNFDPHPNAEGQKLIASKFIAAMSASK
ncbi:MAG: hypothetical protein IJN64_14005 [Lachnospiraceae bacterium]|nr:hypothetical protein [Lachnospiraceae bacterium]